MFIHRDRDYEFFLDNNDVIVVLDNALEVFRSCGLLSLSGDSRTFVGDYYTIGIGPFLELGLTSISDNGFYTRSVSSTSQDCVPDLHY